MNQDTAETVRIDQVEQGMRTLAHDWRNVLNGINLRITSATYAEKPADREADLADAQQLIATATKQLTLLSRKMTAPKVTPIPYLSSFLIEDLSGYLSQQLGVNAMKLDWKKSELSGKAMVDFGAISQAFCELIENTLQRLSGDTRVPISSTEDAGFLAISWSETTSGETQPESWGKAPFQTTERGKLGLGIFYARRVLEAHGGTLKFTTADSRLQTTLRIPLEAV